MASSGPLFPTLVLVLLLLAVPATTSAATTTTTFARAADLAERLEGAGPQQCWETPAAAPLLYIRSCSGEIILFFLNGEAYLGPGCCRAIRTIEQLCWAADLMLSVIGFTPEEGDMLKGYCDAGNDGGGDGHHRSVGGSSPAPPPYRVFDGVAGGSAVAAAAGRKGLGAPLG